MKLIEQSVEYIPQEEGLDGIYKQIERCARVCYKSEDKTDYSNSKNFVDKLIENSHTAMLEHGSVYLKIPFIATNSGESFWTEQLPASSILPDPNQIFNILDYNGIAASQFYHNKYSKLQLVSTRERCTPIKKDIVISESKQGLLTMPESTGYKKDKNGIYYEHIAYVTTNFRVLIENGYRNYLKYICKPSEFHEKRYTLKFITSIGIVRELLRHRRFSFANESTRYCNYSKDKFNNRITFIIPSWMDLPEGVSYITSNKEWSIRSEDFKTLTIVPDKLGYLNLLEVLARSEFEYNDMIKDGLQPQQAREVLPLCTKSELVMTGFASDWRHFFDLRLFGKAGKPHPDMIDLANKAKEEFIKADIWKDIMRYPSKFDKID